MTANDPCAHCPRGREEHGAAEREGVVRHKFSDDGRLVPVDSATVGKPEKVQEVPPPVRITGTPSDPVLRYLLIQKGLITVGELDDAEITLRATGLLATDKKVFRDARQT